MSTLDARANTRRFERRRDELVQGLRWPGGAGLALSFVLNIEEGAEFSVADGDAHNEAVHEITHRVEGAPDYCMGTHFEYGARAGYARILQRFADAGLPLTLNVCGRALQRTPWVAADARQHGFEMCGHGWLWESPAGMDEATERAVIARTVATITQLGGMAPSGWHQAFRKSARLASQRCHMRLGRGRVLAQQQRRPRRAPFAAAARLPCQVGKAQQRVAALARAHEFTRAADLQVAARDLEAVGGLGHGLQPVLAGGRQRRRVQQHAHAGHRAAAHAAAQLVQLARPKRSACSITIRLALGTSTPTSITVVATSTASRPR
jgi:hypothetical protein